MSHLGERLSALVDGELSHAERDRALSHLAACETCRFEAEMLRGLKRRLNGMGAPQPSLDFMGRLSALTGAEDLDENGGTPLGPLGPSSGRHWGFLSGRGRGGGGDTGGDAPFDGFGSSPPVGSTPPLGQGLRGGPGRRPVDPDTVGDPEKGGASFFRLRARWGNGIRPRYAVAGVSIVVLTLGTAFLDGDEAGGEQLAPSDYAVEYSSSDTRQEFPTGPDPGVPPSESGSAPVNDVYSPRPVAPFPVVGTRYER